MKSFWDSFSALFSHEYLDFYMSCASSCSCEGARSMVSCSHNDVSGHLITERSMEHACVKDGSCWKRFIGVSHVWRNVECWKEEVPHRRGVKVSHHGPQRILSAHSNSLRATESNSGSQQYLYIWWQDCVGAFFERHKHKRLQDFQKR